MIAHQNSRRSLSIGVPADAYEEAGLRKLGVNGAMGLLVELPGGCRLRVESPVQLALAAELIGLVAQDNRARC